jgi:hypothetical protein
MSLKSENEPIKWYTFYSQKAGREYYYEPRSGVVTWILPDDLHPQPVVKPSKEVPLGRRVSFHESVENPETPAPRSLRKVGNTTSTKDKLNHGRRIPIIASIIILCLCVLLGTAFFTGWLSRGMLGLEKFGNNADNTEALALTGAFVGNSNEKDIQRVKPRETNNLQHKDGPERRGETLSTTAEETAPLQEKLAEDTANTTADAIRSNVQKKHAEDTAATEQGSKEINMPTKCLIPFAHVFSRKCRKVLAKRPVYDMVAFLDSMI